MIGADIWKTICKMLEMKKEGLSELLRKVRGKDRGQNVDHRS